MDKGTGVRKYGRMGQALRWGKYVTHCLALVPLQSTSILLLFLPVGGVLTAFYCLYGIFFFFPFQPMKSFFCLLGLLASVGISLTAPRWFERFNSNPMINNLLEVIPPVANPLLPDDALLVRASSSSAAQPAELLRAAKETKEQKPEELLRAKDKD
jgi:hypothetical protein